MLYSRRNFIKNASLIGAGTVFGNSLMGCGTNGIKDFGLQLYTLRDVLPQNPKEILKQVASFGYTQLEGFDAGNGIYLGMSNTEFKKYINDLGMTMVSSHCNWEENFGKTADEAAAAGLKYLACSWLGPEPEIDFYKQAAEQFNKCGEVCKKRGMRFAYHNHDYSFKPVQGQLPQDVLMQHTDASVVDFEMDIYWVVAAGQDPVKWLEKYPGRFKLCHVKDRKGDESVNLGTGNIPFNAILKEGKNKGFEYFIVEQEAYTGTTPMEAAKVDAAYMKTLNI